MLKNYVKTVNGEEKSVLDYFIVCKRFFTMVTNMIVDEERAYSLTKYSGRTGNKSVKESDHNTLVMKLNVNWSSDIKETAERVEIFNFKNQEHFQEFVKLSNQNVDLKALFTHDDEDLEVSAKKWLKSVNKMISQSFSKVRIKKGKINPE